MKFPKFLKPSKKKVIILVILLLVIGGGIFFFTRDKKTVPLKYTTVTTQNIEEVISASGVLNGKDSSTLKFKTSGKLAYLNIKEGEEVTKGQVIAGLDTQDLSINLQQAQNDFRTKQAAAEKALDDIKNHSSDETFAQKETRTKAEAARDTAYDEVKAAQRAFQDTLITSPISGTVVNTDVVQGQFVSTSDTIAQVVDWEDIYFDAEVDEADISKVKLGQKAKVSLNSYHDKTFMGTVEKINSLTKTTSSGATVIIVRINLGQAPIQKIINLNGQADIIVSEVKNALAVPPESLIDDNSVYVKTDTDKPKKVTVKIGLVGEEMTQITSGLTEGQQIITNPSAVE